ncbi:ATP-binding protein [Rhizobium glycinendophyticum]|uniref:histidine kinase n=1 Tax=Rhizobium glycinendophyticum TaxID=2589807 RepID=A0A504TX26_9HYPH|nr:ATP-binding protein [Rhizobium glycinendophyticum]TPP05947.1 two-component sensor histidine kinase [Rhizobium glycinendophyticum]
MARKPASLSRRLIASLSGLLFVFWTIAVLLGISVMRDEFDEVFDSALQETTERLVPLVVDDLFRREAREEPYRIADPKPGLHDEYLTYQVRDATGRVLLHSNNVSPEPYGAPLVSGFTDDGDRRIFTVETVSGSLFVQMADSLAHRREATLESALALLLPIMVLLPLGMLATWWLVSRATAPVARLGDAIAERDGTNMTPILMEDLPAELAAIPGSINTLLERLTASLQAERDLAANSAHELRTPLAGALAQTEILVTDLADSPARARALQVQSALRRLSAMLEKLLQLARAEAGIGSAAEPTELLPLFDLVLDDFIRAHPGVTIEVGKDLPDVPVPLQIDPDAFGIAFKNLLENASKYGVEDRPVEVHLSQGRRIRVSNVMPGSGGEDVDQYRQRFRRGRSTLPGSGLGLAIVDRLMAQMNGRLTLRSLASVEGETVFEATLEFD